VEAMTGSKHTVSTIQGIEELFFLRVTLLFDEPIIYVQK